MQTSSASSQRMGASRWAVAFALLAVSCVAAMLAYGLTPRVRLADQRNFDLETVIPKSFGEWRAVEGEGLVLPDPEATRLSDKIYNKVLARIYVGPDRSHVMLVMAYGGDQSDDLQLHRPEVCYSANGFAVSPPQLDSVQIGDRNLVMTRVETKERKYHEPVTYWMRVGERQVTTNMDRQLVKLRMGLAGTIPDGILVRMSSRSLSADPTADYAAHDRFVRELLSAVDPDTRELLIGTVDAPIASSPAGT